MGTQQPNLFYQLIDDRIFTEQKVTGYHKRLCDSKNGCGGGNSRRSSGDRLTVSDANCQGQTTLNTIPFKAIIVTFDTTNIVKKLYIYNTHIYSLFFLSLPSSLSLSLFLSWYVTLQYYQSYTHTHREWLYICLLWFGTFFPRWPLLPCGQAYSLLYQDTVVRSLLPVLQFQMKRFPSVSLRSLFTH